MPIDRFNTQSGVREILDRLEALVDGISTWTCIKTWADHNKLFKNVVGEQEYYVRLNDFELISGRELIKIQVSTGFDTDTNTPEGIILAEVGVAHSTTGETSLIVRDNYMWIVMRANTRIMCGGFGFFEPVSTAYPFPPIFAVPGTTYTSAANMSPFYATSNAYRMRIMHASNGMTDELCLVPNHPDANCLYNDYTKEIYLAKQPISDGTNIRNIIGYLPGIMGVCDLNNTLMGNHGETLDYHGVMHRLYSCSNSAAWFIEE